jgi:sugar lactone lactonase YvrE
LSLSLGLGVVATPIARAADTSCGVERFAEIPLGAPGHPEGLAEDCAGNIYAASFELTASAANQLGVTADNAPKFFPRRVRSAGGAPQPPFAQNYIYVFGSDGKLKTSVPLPEGFVPLGMVATCRELYVANVFGGDIAEFKTPLQTGSTPSRIFDLCGGFLAAFGAPGVFCALNDLDIGRLDGFVYATDNGAGPGAFPPGFPHNPEFNKGKIYRLNPLTGKSEVFFADSRLNVGNNGLNFPPFGVNGIAFAPNGSAMFLANMSTDTLYRLTVSNCSRTRGCVAGTLSQFNAGGTDGPDNMAFDANGILWVASGQKDQIVGFNQQGQVVKRVGSFAGFDDRGYPKGLLQPSGVIFNKETGKVCTGNEANASLRQEPASFWEPLKGFTISCFKP